MVAEVCGILPDLIEQLDHADVGTRLGINQLNASSFVCRLSQKVPHSRIGIESGQHSKKMPFLLSGLHFRLTQIRRWRVVGL